jgi:hypothetical protein
MTEQASLSVWVMAGWVARTRSLSEPLSPRGPQPVLARVRGVGVGHFALPQHRLGRLVRLLLKFKVKLGGWA